MKKNNEKYCGLCIAISAASMILAFSALILSVLALVKSCGKTHISTSEFDYCGLDDEADDEELAF